MNASGMESPLRQTTPRVHRAVAARVPHGAACVLSRVTAIVAVASLMGLSGCAVVTAVGATAAVAATAAATVVQAGVGAVRVTGKAIGKGFDVVTGPGTPSNTVAGGQ